jgi:hypothetical protein
MAMPTFRISWPGFPLRVGAEYLARSQPDLPATEGFSKEEIEAPYVRVHKEAPPRASLNLKEVVRMIGRLGGDLGRTCDGEPSITVIWRGWMSFHSTVTALRAARDAGWIPPS